MDGSGRRPCTPRSLSLRACHPRDQALCAVPAVAPAGVSPPFLTCRQDACSLHGAVGDLEVTCETAVPGTLGVCWGEALSVRSQALSLGVQLPSGDGCRLPAGAAEQAREPVEAEGQRPPQVPFLCGGQPLVPREETWEGWEVGGCDGGRGRARRQDRQAPGGGPCSGRREAVVCMPWAGAGASTPGAKVIGVVP